MARTREDCLRQLASLAPAAGLSTIGTAILVALWLHGQTPPALLNAWLGALFLLGGGRFLFALAFKHRFRSEQSASWERGYALLTGITGFCWGLLAWMPLPGADQGTLFIAVVVLCSVLLVGSSTLVASTLALGSFSLALGVPFLARALTMDARFAFFVGIGLLIMTAVLVSAIRSHRETLLAAILGRNEIDALLQQQKVIFESAGEGIVFLRPAPEYVVSCNRRFAELFGYPHDAMIGMEPWRWHPNREQWKALVKSSAPTITSGRPYHQVLRLQRADGSQFWGEVTGMGVSTNELRDGTVWVVSDITEKRAAEAALRLSEARFRDLVKLSSDLYWEQDAAFRFTHFDGPEELLRRLPQQHILGRTRWEVEDISGVQEAAWRNHIGTLERHEAFHDFSYRIEGADGEKYWLSVSGNPRFNDAGNFIGYHGVTSDITLRVEAEERYRHLAYHDTLTRLPNRRLLTDRLDQAIRGASRRGNRIALLLLDLDGFKQINDRHGHAAGDRVLETVAARLRETVRDADTVARLGGDEFVVLLHEVGDVGDAATVAEKIHARVSEPIWDGEYIYSVGTSIGISVFPEHGDTPDALLHRADRAMYHGKSNGGKTTRIFEAAAPD
ncbi:MAG: diguanylate cyclase [Rhodocyclales bacterium]|nr:diguanylate cyclase [Rhodocyclales bacterium]